MCHYIIEAVKHSGNYLYYYSTVEQTAEAVAADVTTTIMAQRLELEDKNKSIVMLQKALVSMYSMCVCT